MAWLCVRNFMNADLQRFNESGRTGAKTGPVVRQTVKEYPGMELELWARFRCWGARNEVKQLVRSC